MNYIEKHPKPQCCKVCPEMSVEVCFHCEHLRERFEVLDSELAEEQLRRYLLRKLLKVETDEDYFVLRWKPVTHRPVNNTYVLLKERDEEFGVMSCVGCYEKDQFWYFGDGDTSDSVPENRILGWDYLPYDDHLNENEEKLLDAFLKRMGKAIREEMKKQEEENRSMDRQAESQPPQG